MKTKLNIKNFRVFDEKGESLELNPITILTGRNSSGKSSVVKAVLLLNSLLAQIKKDVVNGEAIELDKYKLDFTQYPNNLLGRFDKVVNEKSNNKTISIGFSVHSLMLSKEVYVDLVFSADENDVLNNAFLESIEMSTDEGVFYSSSNSEPSYCNLNILKKEFVTFSVVEYAIHAYCKVTGAYEIEGGITKDEYKSKVNPIVEYLRNVDKPRKDDILRYIRFTNSYKSSNKTIIETERDGHTMEQMNEDGVIFSIPLLDKLEEINKAEVESFINSHLMNDASDGFTAATNKVMKAYLQSEFDKFSAFFHDFEEKYLEHVVCKNGILNPVKNGVRTLTPNQLSLNGSFLFNNPFDSSTLIKWDDILGYIEPTEEEKTAEKRKEIQEWENSELTFELLYEIVMAWNRKYEDSMDLMATTDNQTKRPYVYKEPSMWNPTGSVYHIVYELLTKFAAAVVTEALTPEWGGNMSYVSSARASVSRLYTLDSNDDFSQLLRDYFEKKRLFLNNKSQGKWTSHGPANTEYDPDSRNSFMNQWVRNFKIGDSLSPDVDKEGLGVQIRLHKTKNDDGRLLADEGYGITQLVSILLQIETAILSAQGEKVNRYIGLDDLDKYESSKFHYEVNTISIEEPEIHLHPKYQSMLAEMFVEAYQEYNIHFIIETHSEYLIRKLQVMVADKDNTLTSNKVSLNYVDKDENGISHNRQIKIQEDGRLSEPFGPGFFDEADTLAMEIMKYKTRRK